MTRVLGAALALLLAMPVSAEEVSYLTLTAKDKDYSPTVTAIKVPVADNPLVKGENPLTGEPWDGVYKPVMTTIDVHPEAYPLWGVSCADIMFEMPLEENGATRCLALFMSEMPSGAGPVRSSRIAAASIREIFDAPMAYYGMRTVKSTSVKDWWRKYHPEFYSTRFDYPIVDLMQPRYKEINQRVKDGHQNPHNVQVDVAAIRDMAERESKPVVYRFSDEGMTSGDRVNSITIVYRYNWDRKNNTWDQKQAYVPSYEYDEESGLYYRFNNGNACIDGVTYQPLTYANLILLRTDVTWKGSPGAVIPLVGQGVCDIFINGYYQRGTWVRASSKKANEANSLDERFVFLDANGEELTLKRGSTFISIMDNEQEVNIAAQGSVNIKDAKQGPTPAPTVEPVATRTPRPTRTPKPDSGAQSTQVDHGDDDEGDLSFGG